MGKYLLIIAALFNSALGFEVIPDTLNLLKKDIDQIDSIPFISNQSGDTIKIDSMYVTKYHTNSNYFEAQVGIISGSAQHMLVYSFFDASRVNGRELEVRFEKTKIPPHTMVYVERARIDYCVDCPAAKISSKLIVGDTLSITMVFVSGNQKDSLTILGLEKQGYSSGVAPEMFSVSSGENFQPSWNAMGRKSSNSRIEPEYSIKFSRTKKKERLGEK